jgi:hypothetical protein
MLRIKKRTLTPSFIIFTFRLTFESFKEYGGASLAHNQSKKINGTNLTIDIVSFKTNVPRTLNILPTPRGLKIKS